MCPDGLTHKVIEHFICITGERPLNITTRTGLVGFFLALSALQVSGATAATSQPDSATDSLPTVESRLTRLTASIRQRESQLSQEMSLPIKMLLAGSGWGNGAGRGFANRTGPGGFVNAGGGGGGFVNGGGFRNGGGFWNY
jgi:rSAM-associated Gly-rich repeat protein